jgi:hypothetical protein
MAGILFTVAALTLSGSAFAKDVKVSLTGAEETPPVATSAKGAGTMGLYGILCKRGC